MNAFSALAGLHCVASQIEQYIDDPKDVLDLDYWKKPIIVKHKRDDSGKFHESRGYCWESLVFGIVTHFDFSMWISNRS